MNRCKCHKISFLEIKELAEASGITRLSAVKQDLKLCRKCCKCNPYVRIVLRDGITSFEAYKLD